MRKKAEVKAADEVSEVLADTRAVARSSYIHPTVFDAYRAGSRGTSSASRSNAQRFPSKMESALIRFLRDKRDSRVLACRMHSAHRSAGARWRHKPMIISHSS